MYIVHVHVQISIIVCVCTVRDIVRGYICKFAIQLVPYMCTFTCTCTHTMYRGGSYHTDQVSCLARHSAALPRDNTDTGGESFHVLAALPCPSTPHSVTHTQCSNVHKFLCTV